MLLALADDIFEMKAKMTDVEPKIETEEVEKVDSVEPAVVDEVVLSETDSYEPEGDGVVEPEAGVDEEVEEVVDAEGEVVAEKTVDDDLDRRNPQYIPKAGAFYEHDNRTLDDEKVEDNAESDKKKKVWKESKVEERWLHDNYVEEMQGSKSTQEIVATYGYDIRKEENAPRARRRRKYGRGPDKYERKWDDEEAYTATQKPGRGRGRGKIREDFPPLPHQNGQSPDKEPVKDSGRGKPFSNTAWRSNPPPGENRNEPRTPRGYPTGKPSTPHTNQHAGLGSKSTPPNQESNKSHQTPPRPRMEDHIKPFRNDGGAQKTQEPLKGRTSDSRTSSGNQMGHPSRGLAQDLSQPMANMSIHQKQKPREVRTKETVEVPKNQPVDNAANKQNPKRYSKIRKGFTGYFPPEDCADLDPREAKAALEMVASPQTQPMGHMPPTRQQDIIVQSVNVLQRYPDTYNGNAAYIPARPILQPMPQPGLAAPAPITQALSPGYVPSPLYIDMGQGEVVPFQGYTTYPQGQSTELYQASSGITYYRPEIQAGTNQGRALPQRRKAAIPIVPPPEAR